MLQVLQFLQKNEIWIYIALGLVAVIYIRKLLISLREWRSAIFGLEREHAQRQFGAILSIFVLLVLIMAAEFVTVTFVVPAYPGISMMLTPTIDLLATPTLTLEPNASTTVEPVNIIGQQPTIASEGCIAGQVEWTYPVSNDEVSGTVELKGTVNVSNLGFFKFEFSQPGSTTWVTIAAGDEIKIDAPLGGLWNTSQLIPGDYLLRLVVTDNQNVVFPACIIPVTVVVVP
jgi:hypothetical protein